MNVDLDDKMKGQYWFVGASFSGTEDQSDRFIDNGIWENGYNDRYLDVVKSINIGDSIAIKSFYTRKNSLPFEANKQYVSVMRIKAIGTVIKNFNNGLKLEVKWDKVGGGKEWYFLTSLRTVWKVIPDNLEKRALIDFTFCNIDQDYDSFKNSTKRMHKYGDNKYNSL